MNKDNDQEGSRRAFSLAGLVPELAPPFAKTAPVRIPELRNVALTKRVLEVIDHPDFQRLRRVLQLGPTHLVYPGATHTRFEHSIGVFENVRRYLMSLLLDREFVASAKEEDVLTGLAAGLLHDLGHYPFAHSLEALHHKGLEAPCHEEVGEAILFGRLSDRPIAPLLERQWGVDPKRVMRLVTCAPEAQPTPIDSMLSSILHCPIDADKMDYLERDSIHMGVPYGRNYDRDRLLSTLAIHPGTHKLAVTDKGKISAEIFIFGRYTMFSEAYWHHAVRAASAMVERALEDFRLRAQLDHDSLLSLLLGNSDENLVQKIHQSSPPGSTAARITRSFAGGTRRLYKRLLSLSLAHRDQRFRVAYEKVLNLCRTEVHQLEEALRERLSKNLGRELHPADLIVDTPPPGKHRTEELDVVFAGKDTTAKLSDLSETAKGIGVDFVRTVTKIRVFVEPEAAAALRERHGHLTLAEQLLDTILGLAEPKQRELL